MSATDATTVGVGAAETFIDQSLARSLFDAAEYRGFHTYLPSYKVSEKSFEDRVEHYRADPLISDLGTTADWVHTHSQPAPADHVNVHELAEILECGRSQRECSRLFGL